MDHKRKAEILDLLSEAFGEEHRRFYKLQLRVWEKKDPDAFFIKEEGGRVVAYLLAATYYTSRESRKYAYLYCVATKEEMRGKGIMTALFSEALHTLERRGYDGAFLVPTDESLVAFYEKLGFRRRMTPAYNYPPVDGREYLIPGEAAQIYLEASGEKEGMHGETILPLMAGWMVLPFGENGELKEEVAPVWPLP